MNCRRVRRLLQNAAADELPGELQASVLRHVDGCPRCAAELSAWKRLMNELHRPRPLVDVPAGLDSLQLPQDQGVSRRRWALVSAAVTGVVVLAVIVVLSLPTTRRETSPPAAKSPVVAIEEPNVDRSGDEPTVPPTTQAAANTPKPHKHATAHAAPKRPIRKRTQKKLPDPSPQAPSPAREPEPPAVAPDERPMTVIAVTRPIEPVSIEVSATDPATGETNMLRCSLAADGSEQAISIQSKPNANVL